MGHEHPFKFKICLIGENAVGKTSLIRRFVYDIFEDKYLTTMGLKITKKEIKMYNSKMGGPLNSCLILWDIMGQKSFRELFNGAYFFGVNGIIAVCDVTRENTLMELDKWMETALHHAGEMVPIMFLGNKCDLVDKQQLDLDDIGKFASDYSNAEAFLTSAKTGLNVEVAFKTLSEKVLEEKI